MVRLNFVLVAFVCGLLLQSSKCQSVKGGSRGVKGGGSQSTQHHSSSSSSQHVQETVFQRQTYPQSNAAINPNVCGKLEPPMNGRYSCKGTSHKYTCIGACSPGFKFSDQTERIELECMPNGQWMPYSSFPDCIGGSYGGGYGGSSHGNTYGGGYSQSSSSSSSSGHGTGQYSQSSHGSYGSGQGYGQSHSLQQTCVQPKSPVNARTHCSSTNGQWTCIYTCNPSYKFPDGHSQITISCNERDNVWSPFTQVPDCILFCHPECENGGQCSTNNQCLCPATHRGNRCQYPVTLCDFNRIGSRILHQCRHNPEYTECHISCPPGMAFQPPTTSLYRCTVDGHWNPPNAPECVTDSLCEAPPGPNNGRIECRGNHEVMLCTGTCNSGYLFPDGFSVLNIQCVIRTGEWSPGAGFPDCEPICNPSCRNGGKCLGHNRCLCPQGYRGGQCQYALSSCDGHDRFAAVAWSCKNNERETVCEISCGQTTSKLQPPEHTVYTCSLDGTWEPDLKPICVADYSLIDARSSTNERIVVGETTQVRHGQQTVHQQTSSGHRISQSSHGIGGQESEDYEFGGQQQIQHEFGGQQQIQHEFGGQRQIGHEFGGQQQIGHEFGGQQQMQHEFGGQQQMQHEFGGQQQVGYGLGNQQMNGRFGGQQQINNEFGGQNQVDYDFNEQQQVDNDFDIKREKLNIGGYSDYGKETIENEEVDQQHVADLYLKPPYTRQEEGKEAFDEGFNIAGNKEKVVQYTKTQENAQVPEQIATLTDAGNMDPFSRIEIVSNYHGICSIWGYHHYRSFDGGLFTFPSTCPYILASNCGHDDLVISMLTQCDSHAPCERIIEIQLQENTYMLSYEAGLRQNGMSLPIPTHAGELTVEKITRYLVARLTTGFTIWINEENTVLIVASQFMKNRTCGMCGNFDGYLDTKFLRADGIKTRDIYSFANSWKRDPEGICVDNTEHASPCNSNTREKRLASDNANLLCQSLYDADFHPCAKYVDPQLYFEKCQMDCCSMMSEINCECASIAEYILECSRNGVDMKEGWRKPGLCPLPCSNGTEYRECGPPCPPTCDDQEPTCQQERCVDGCHCPEGTVLENGHCITVDQCPCHHGKRIYASGETMNQDCNTCVCQGGSWQCTDSLCPATCSISGPHYQTFDGLSYDFSGQCTHYLVFTEDSNIQIDYSNNCRNPESLMSVCIRSITIHTSEGAIVKLKQTMEVSVNGREMIGLPVLAPGIYVGQATSKYIRALLNNGLEILWDMDSSVQVFAPVDLFDLVTGLCGTFTKNQQDDFLTPEGDIEKSSQVFAQKWKVDESCFEYSASPQLDKPCDRAPARRDYAVTVCRVIKEDEFQECHSLVDYQRYFDDCLEDVCGCMHELSSCACLSLSNYAKACAKKGKVLSWRQNLPVCGIPCPRGQIYLPCANPCTYTCSEIAHSYASCREDCVEGCVCPPGQTLDIHGECVPVSSCSCVHSGHVYPPEFLQRRGSEMCSCAQGQWACHKASPADIILTPPPNIAPECDASANFESTDCMSECPVTCSNLHHHQPCTTAICEPGCRCKKGYVLDAMSEKCVKPVDCPCHHSGKSYEEGEQVMMDCHSCICESGTWICDTNPCPGLCSAWGDSHFETFDGRLFDFEGSCDYVMVKAHVSDHVIFSVVIQNIPCGENGGATCGKSLSITLGDQSVTLTRDHPIPDIPEGSPLSLSSVGMYTLIESEIGISVQWDRNTKVYVIAQPIWENKLQGLCGDFNSDSSDDFRSPSGGIPLVLAKDFADSWRVHKYCKPASQPEDTCDKHPERRTWSKHKCAILKSELFQPCHYQVEVEEYFKRCVLDACACSSGGDCECMCAVVSAYAQKCARRGVVIPWRSQDLCPVQCEQCDRYNPCISLCPPPNCDTYLEDSENGHSCSRQPCVDGCEPKPCGAGQVYRSASNQTCIPETFCTEKPCTVIDGVPYREGERIENRKFGDACQSCYCRRGEVECIGVPCGSTTSRPIILVEVETCEFTGWTDWINSMDPTDNNGNDEEDLRDLLDSMRIPCPLSNITSIQCRNAETQEPSESAENEVTCDLEKGLRCKRDYVNGDCEDYEIRVFCECEKKETCPPGQGWNPCAFSCDNVCHALESYLEKEKACERNGGCVPGCVQDVCEFPKLARDAETCVLPEMCTCRLSSGYVLAPGEVITDGCQKCQCLNNTLICSTILECMKEKEIIPAREHVLETTPPPVLEMKCTPGWTEWENFHLPDSLGERETLEDFEREEALRCAKNQVTQIQCRQVNTPKVSKYSDQFTVHCDLDHNGLECRNRDMPLGERCLDFEMRVFCDCQIPPARIIKHRPSRPTPRPTTELPGAKPSSTLPPDVYPNKMGIVTIIPTRKPEFGIISTTPSCSSWSDWINKGKPRRGKNHGEKEDTKPYVLTQTEEFCNDGTIDSIECRDAITDLDYTETKEEKLICDLNKGFICKNRDQPDKRCNDYKIRYFCNCGMVTTEVPLLIKTTPTPYIYPCSELIPLVDGTKPISDSQIKASSSESYRSGPDAIRMNSKGKNKAWTAEKSNKHQFVEVDLGDVRAVYGIVTKGKEDSDEFVTSYQLLYSNDRVSYSYYQDENDQNKVFSGNYDDTVEVKHIFDKPFEARFVRLEPLSWERKISLRMDLLGCSKAILVETTSIPEVTTVGEEIDEEACKEPVGIEDKNVGVLTASSIYKLSTSAEKGRMGSDTAWVAGVTNDHQFLQIKFPGEAFITGVVTKGRTDEPQWVSSYKVAVSDDGKDWEKLEDDDYETVVFEANSDEDTRVTNMLPSPVKAHYIRIMPVTWEDKISMQVEILGCLPEVPGEFVTVPGKFVTVPGKFVTVPEEEEEDEEHGMGMPDTEKKCKRPMGLENGLLMDSQLSASSSYSSKFTPDFARLGSSSVWAAAVNNNDQYLQVDFIDEQRVRGIITKGREDIPQWVTAYVVEFSKNGEVWNKVKSKDGDQIEFAANYDPFSTVKNLFPRTIRARYLKIRPTNWKNWISMQIELLGCYHPKPCRDPMGIENGVVKDLQLASSSETSDLLSANNGRLTSPTAWAPSSFDRDPYVQVDLLEPVNLTAIVTKGNREDEQWVTSFIVAYSNDSINWKKVLNNKGKMKEFIGNEDQDSAVINLFPTPFVARYVRISPLGKHRRYALRFDLLGCFHEQVCKEPMGLENGLLSDAQITATSSSDPTTTPSHARLNDKSGWQPDETDSHPHIEVDFLEPTNVSAVVTKGMGDVDNWVTKFKITYSKDRHRWYPLITDEGDDVLFDGNEDRDTPVVNTFPRPVVARFFRIVPLKYEKAIGLRLELLGCYHPRECQEPMGMESGSAFDFQITASSFLSDEFSPAMARLDGETAWVADTNDKNPYIQVDFMVPTNLTGVITRGRNDANEWVTEYKIDFSPDGVSLYSVTDDEGIEKTYSANYDSESPVTNVFEEPIFARILRIKPTAHEKKTSMRFEVLGCFHKTECLEPMGLENGLLTDSHITASSFKSENTDPTQLRLSSESSWMPEAEDNEHYIQVDLLEPKNVSGIVTKGDASEPKWVTSFQVEYSDDGDTWSPIGDETKEEARDFPANTDNETPVINIFPETILARYFRIIPVNWNDEIALRAELLGCYHPIEEEPSPELTTIPELVLPYAGVYTEPPLFVQCPDPMEPEISLLAGARITASSSAPDSGPSRVVLNTQSSNGLSGGWVPDVDDTQPILYITLPETRWLTSMYVQGREDEENWVTSLRVVANLDGKEDSWMPVFGLDGDEVLQANEDQNSIVGLYFKDPVEARYVQIIPESWHRWPSFRLDLRGCRTVEVPPVPPTTEEPKLCPELIDFPFLALDCPEYCPDGQLCDGENCVDPVDCACVRDGKIFQVSDRMEDRFCRICDCALGGHSVCSQKQCEPCEEGKAVLNEDCTCTCEECEEGEVLCPSTLECIPEKRWCDGTVDCLDDEIDCLTTTEKTTIPEEEIIFPGKIPSSTTPSPGFVVPSAPYIPAQPTPVAPVVPIIPVPPAPENGTCNIMGNRIKTFDGQDINYDVCNHVVFKDILNNKFKVTIHKDCNYIAECKHWIEISYLNQHIKVPSDLNVEVNGHRYTASQLLRLSKNLKMRLFVKKVGDQVIVTSVVDKFTIVYDNHGHLEINVLPELLKKISGLCGYYSGKLEDDQRKPNGKKAFTSQEFADSWAVEGKGKCKPLICPHEEMAKAMELCHQLKEKPFVACGKILPLNQFIEFCMSTTCECLMNKNYSEERCKCDGLETFVEVCESKLGPLAVRNWRLIHECHSACPPGMEWNDCGPSCQLTCDSSSKELQECSGKCIPGCFCPAGTVLNDDECIPPDQCRDQVCQGFGDPHFKTFDGLFFPFQAVGSFLIVSDEGKNFEVKGLSAKCGLFNPITCLIGMEIVYKTHKILIRKSKEIQLDGKVLPMDNLPVYEDGMVILGYPGRTFVIVVPLINFEARYYEENSGFAVRVPSRKYFNQTRGLCGNCNRKLDDELKNQPLNKYVCSFQTEGNREDCMKDLEELPELTERAPVCEKLKHPIFEACHPLVEVDVYVEACNFDATHSGDSQASFCKTALEYGRQCCQAGIIIDEWPTELECDIDCPSGMSFKQCYKGCPQTCLKNDTADSSCEHLRMDGCFCPPGKVLKDNACIDDDLCETCDEEGHAPGDKWNEEDCKHCECHEDLKVKCTLEICPPEPICSDHETLMEKEVESESPSCCKSFVCVPQEEECPRMEIPKCKTGEAAKVHKSFNTCPHLECECDPILCAPLTWPENLEIGQQAVISNDSCCPTVQIVCFDKLCPDKLECQDQLELVEEKGECCTTYKCKPPKDVCVFSHSFKIVDGFQALVEQVETDNIVYQPGDEWEDGLCEKCSCVESKGQYVPMCIMEHCPSLEDMPESKEYVLQEVKLPNKCCPEIVKTQCRDEDGNTYEPGDQWQDEDDPCVTYLCEQEGTGNVVKIKSIINCSECSKTEVLFPPSKALGQCCGFCKPARCQDGDEIHEVGDLWPKSDDVCITAECVRESGRIFVLHTRQPCQRIPEDCPPDKIILDENGCCQVCNLTSEVHCNSAPIPEEETVGFFKYNDPYEGGMCVNEKPVANVLQCKGACHSRNYYSLEDGDFKGTCECCKVNVTTNRTVELRCPNGNLIRKTYLQPETCQCSKCAPKSGLSKKNSFNSQPPWERQVEQNPDSESIFGRPGTENEQFERNQVQQQVDDDDELSNGWNQFGQNQVQQQIDDDDELSNGWNQFGQNQVQQQIDDDDELSNGWQQFGQNQVQQKQDYD